MMKRFCSLSFFFVLVIVAAFGQNRRLEKTDQAKELSRLLERADRSLDSAGLFDTTSSYLEQAQRLANQLRHDSALIVIQNYYGLANFNRGNFHEATACYYAGLELAEASGNLAQKSKLLNNLGMIYDELEDYDKAISLYRQSHAIDSLVGNEAGVMRSFINLAISYQNKNLADTAFVINKKALVLAERLKDSLSLVNIINNQGTIEYDRKHYAESLAFYQEALALYRSMNNQDGIATTLNNIGLVYLDQKEYPQALSSFLAALDIVNEIGLYNLSGNVYSNLAVYYEEVGDYQNAYQYYNLFNEVYDSLIGEKKNLMIRKLEAQYNLEKKQREILELQQQNQAQLEEIQARRITQSYMYLIIFLVIFSLVVVFYLLYKERKLSLELKEKTEELKKLNNAKDKFFSIIAHDLKNPFNALVSYTSLLREDFERFSRDEIKQIIVDLNNATEQGFKLLENLLYWTRSQTNRIKVFRTKFNLRQICEDVEDLAKSNLHEKSQLLVLDMPSETIVFADKDMISTVVRNLVFNAIKFSHRDTVIRITCERLPGELKVMVSDQGVGIRESDLERIFQYTENTTTYGTEGESGSGLGLVICREFVEKNRGKIGVNSSPDKGATFYFTIPLAETTSKNG
ncbi:MAG: tetratricopeptide repeat protein [Mangrovibacterium sp.]